MAVARPAAHGQAFFVDVRVRLCLVYSFVTNDFSVLNVAQNSNSQLPLEYQVAASWGSHEGSLLLWVLMLAWWTFAVSVLSQPPAGRDGRARHRRAWAWSRSASCCSCCSPPNPFDRLFPAAADGRDLNPLLQDPGMVFHPPMLYMGYVGFSVAFAFAIAALIGGRLDAAWARWSRPWTTVAWVFLTLGIALGSWWAYYELGWGGWWFWDPVENASFMPWLVGTALIHSLAVTEKRGSFKSWTVLLAICAFSLSLLGTFLVRSGVLTSVHAFATDPRRGVFILAFLVVVIGASLALFAWRAPKVGLGGSFDPCRASPLLLINNVLLAVACAAGAARHAVPAVHRRARPRQDLGRPAVLRRGVRAADGAAGVPDGHRPDGALEEGRAAAISRAACKWALGVSLVAAMVAAVHRRQLDADDRVRPVPRVLADRRRSSPTSWSASASSRAGCGTGSRRRAAAYWGMQLAHLGIAVFIIGVTLVKGYEVERDVRMDVGDTVAVGGYAFKFEGTREVAGPNYSGARGTIERREGRQVRRASCIPEKRIYNVQQMPMTEAAIDTGIFGDLYVSLGEPVGGERLGRARLLQALRQLDLGRLRADGARRPVRARGSPLPAAGAARRGGTPSRTQAPQSDMSEALNPDGVRQRRNRSPSCGS